MDLDGKKQYSTALLECNTGRRLVTICPLAFGEVGVKERVKNVLNQNGIDRIVDGGDAAADGGRLILDVMGVEGLGAGDQAQRALEGEGNCSTL